VLPRAGDLIFVVAFLSVEVFTDADGEPVAHAVVRILFSHAPGSSLQGG
jgi:hypothetical protein